MRVRTNSDLGGFWAILWRSVAFLPYMFLVFVCVGGVWLGRWLLPIRVAVLLYMKEWPRAALTCSVWLSLVWAYRRFRLGRFFEPPPSLL